MFQIPDPKFNPILVHSLLNQALHKSPANCKDNPLIKNYTDHTDSLLIELNSEAYLELKKRTLARHRHDDSQGMQLDPNNPKAGKAKREIQM
jgi:hypothetical protein